MQVLPGRRGLRAMRPSLRALRQQQEEEGQVVVVEEEEEEGGGEEWLREVAQVC